MFGKYRWLQPALLSEGIFPQEVLSLDSEADETAKNIISALNTVDPSSSVVELPSEPQAPAALVPSKEGKLTEEEACNHLVQESST